jgi:hypothetical protein
MSKCKNEKKRKREKIKPKEQLSKMIIIQCGKKGYKLRIV